MKYLILLNFYYTHSLDWIFTGLLIKVQNLADLIPTIDLIKMKFDNFITIKQKMEGKLI